MFRFSPYSSQTCNTLPQCGEDCHDLNYCYDRSTYVDSEGVTRYIFSTFDEEWNLTCTSGEACDQEVFDLPPKYHRQYAPCCWEIAFTGGIGSGTCGQSCDKNYTYLTNPRYYVDVGESGSASVYLRSFMYGHGTGRCNTPNDIYPFYSGELLIGTITDPTCGIDGRELSGVMTFTQANNVPSLCDYSDVVATYTAKYTRQECTSTHVASNFNLDWVDCLDVDTIIVSGWPGCYTQDGDSIVLGDPYSNEYEISLYSALNFALVDFEVQGVIGHDTDVPEVSSLKTTCYECETINRTWLPGDWNGQSPYDPKSICCKCPSTDMCINSWSIDLSQPSSIISLGSHAHGVVAKWLAEFPDSGCVIDPSGGSWDFNYLWQAEPGSGDLPIESGFWNRCDFTGSTITVNYSSDFIPNVPKSGVDCQEELGNLPNGHCHICADRNGPLELMVTVDLQNPDTTQIGPCYCSQADRNGTFILSRRKSLCRDEITIRPGTIDCPCSPCSSGAIYPNSCEWVLNTNCGLSQPDREFIFPLINPRVSGLCGCNNFPVDANGMGPIHFQWLKTCTNCSSCCNESMSPTVYLSELTISGVKYLYVGTNIYVGTGYAEESLVLAPLSGIGNIDCGTDLYSNLYLDCSIDFSVTLPIAPRPPDHDGGSIIIETL